MIFVFLADDIKCLRYGAGGLPLCFLADQSAQDVILEVIRVPLGPGELHRQMLLARRIIMEGIHHKLHVHDARVVEQLDDLPGVAHVARETIRVPRDDAIGTTQLPFALGQIDQSIFTLYRQQQIVELRSVIFAGANTFRNDVQHMQSVPFRKVLGLFQLLRHAGIAISAFIALPAVDHIVLRPRVFMTPSECELHVMNVWQFV